MSNQNQTSQNPAAASPPTPVYIQTAIGGAPLNTQNRKVISRKNGIVIDMWSSGDNDQLWVFNANGSISPYNDPTVVLTAQSTSPTSANQVTLEPVGQSLTSAQIWYQNNLHIWAEMGGSIGNAYLNLEAANLAPGTSIITYESSVGDNEKWFVYPMIPTQAFIHNFYIQTSLSGGVNSQANPCVLANDSGIVINQWQPGDPSQIWSLNPDGSIRPVADGTLVLTAQSTNSTSANQVTLESVAGTNGTLCSAQVWSYSGNQLSVNMGGSIGEVYLNVWGSDQTPGTEVITYEQTNGKNETWYLIPAEPIIGGEWFYLKTEMPDSTGDRTTYVMTVTDAPLAAGAGVYIEPWTPGSVSQLWKMTEGGIIVNALNLGLGLASNGYEASITMQPLPPQGTYSQSGYNFNWHLTDNNLLASGPSGSVYFLNVREGTGNASAGMDLIAFYYLIGLNQNWIPLPYEPEGLWFTIENSAPQANSLSSLLTVTMDGSITMAPPMGGIETPTLQAAKYQLWRKTIDGYIQSATHSGLVLTADPAANLSLELLTANNPNQQWYSGCSKYEKMTGSTNYILAGTIENAKLKQVLSNAALIAPPSSPSSNELWYIAPYAVSFGESTTIRNFGGGVADLFLTLLPKKGELNQIVVDSVSGDPAFSTWQYEYPGYIVNVANADLVLSLEVDTTGTLDNPKYLNNVVVYPRQPNTQLFQLWTVANGQIINQFNCRALTIASASLSSTVSTQAVSNDPKSANQLWDFSAGRALQTVVAQPRLDYPSFTGGQLTAYKEVCQKLNVTDLRMQYINLTAPLAGYLAQMTLMLSALQNGGALPSGTTLQNFTEVITQLIEEITAVSAVQALFQQVTTLYQSLSQAQALTLSELFTACALPNTVKVPPAPKKKKGWIGALIEGILYTGLNLVPLSFDNPFLSLANPASIANIMSTVFATYQGAEQSSTAWISKLNKAEQNAFNYEMTVSQLQQRLLEEFEATGKALGNLGTFILTDWWKTQAVYAMSRNTSDRPSLFWPPTLTAIDVNQMLKPYTLSVLKTLLPANAGYTINTFMHINYPKLNGSGWQGDYYYIDNPSDGTQNEYSTNVPEQIMHIGSINGMDTDSFFNGLNGWNVSPTYLGILDIQKTGTSGASCLVNIENFTNMPLSIQLDLQYLIASSYSNNNGASANIPVSPYSAAQFAGYIAVIEDISHGNGRWYGQALQTNKSPGVKILCDKSPVISFDIENSCTVQDYGSASDIPPCTYTTENLTTTAPFSCTIKQHSGTSGMVFIMVKVTAN